MTIQYLARHRNNGTAPELRRLPEMGRNGLPPAAAASPRLLAEGQAPADQTSTVEQALAQQQNDALQAEQEVQQAANSAQ